MRDQVFLSRLKLFAATVEKGQTIPISFLGCAGLSSCALCCTIAIGSPQNDGLHAMEDDTIKTLKGRLFLLRSHTCTCRSG